LTRLGFDAYKKIKKRYFTSPLFPPKIKENTVYTLYYSRSQHTKNNLQPNIRFLNLYVKKQLLQKYGIESLDVPIPGNLKFKEIIEVRLIHCYDYFKAAYIYKEEDNELSSNPNNRNFLAIDIGLNNLCTMINNVNNQPIIIDGKKLKSINHYYNKTISHYNSITYKVNMQFNSHKINSLYSKRNNYIKNYLHQTSSYIIKYCQKYNINTIIIGYNKGLKQNIIMKKKTNSKETFYQIPFTKLINYLEYKSKLNSINFIIQDESYTSKANSIKLDMISKDSEFHGKRIKRGLFKTDDNHLINADVNAAINIARKCIGESLNPWINELASIGSVNMPIRVRII
jgi:putative transposase